MENVKRRGRLVLLKPSPPPTAEDPGGFIRLNNRVDGMSPGTTHVHIDLVVDSDRAERIAAVASCLSGHKPQRN